MKAVLIHDKDLPDDSVEYTYPHSKLDRIKFNAIYGTVSALLRTPGISKFVNRYLTNKAASSGTNRPYQFSCKTDYTSYDSLTDYTYYGRHLEPASKEYLDSLPPVDEVTDIFRRKQKDGKDIQILCPRSTMLFPTFAQHLVDSFIVTAYKKSDNEEVMFDWRKTDSPHDIGLLPLYGRTIEQTTQLRLRSEEVGNKGKLKFQIINGEEWSPFLFDSSGEKKQEFSTLPDPEGLETILKMNTPEDAKKKKTKIFAFGGSRTNLTPNIAAWNTLLLREHNYIANKIEKENPEWDDERVFQTARNVNLAIYLKLVVEEYIAHITAYGVDPYVDPGKWMWDAPWYKRNWISAEFAVLYRWHAIIPNCMKWGKETLPTLMYCYSNNLLLDENGMNGDLRQTFINISEHRATSMLAGNSENAFMVRRDAAALRMGRACELKPFTEYCKYLGLQEPKTFADITKNKDLQGQLEKIYGKVENIEFWTGLIASDHPTENIMSKSMQKFVANDAFNQALTHPLLSEHVWGNGEKTFSKVGFEMVKKETKIYDIVQRNTSGGTPIDGFIGMTNPYYKIPPF